MAMTYSLLFALPNKIEPADAYCFWALSIVPYHDVHWNVFCQQMIYFSELILVMRGSKGKVCFLPKKHFVCEKPKASRCVYFDGTHITFCFLPFLCVLSYFALLISSLMFFPSKSYSGCIFLLLSGHAH